MENINPQQYKRRIQSNTGKGDLQKQLLMIFRNWYYFLICLVVFLIIGYLYINNSVPTYRVTTTLLIEEEDDVNMIGADNLLHGIGLRQGAQNLENQIDILSSRAIIRKTLGELPFDIDCYRKRLFKRVSYYPLDPIDVVPHYDEMYILNKEFYIKHFNNEMFILGYKEYPFIKSDTILSYGQKALFHGGSFTILPNSGLLQVNDSKQKIYFRIFDNETLVEQYRRRLKIEPTSREGSIVKVILEGTNKTKDKIFLDKLSEVYMASQLEKKNREANRIVEFIDNQLVSVSDSLILTENRLQEFRSENRIMDISAQAQQIIDQAVVLENEKAELTIESNYYEYLSDYLSQEATREAPIAPVSMGINDHRLASLIQELTGLQAEYFSSDLGIRNPIQAQLETKIRNTKQALSESLQGIQRVNMMAIEENEAQIRRLNIQASALPIKERQLLGIEREFNLNNVLYTFLLQRRAEAQIQKASNKPDVELVDSAEADMLPIAPKRPVVYLLCIFFGIGIPLSILLLEDSVQNKISSEEDIHRITNLPLVGHIPHSRLSYSTVVLNEPQSRIAEAFRSLRTRMEFFTRETRCPIILISSTMPEEGKTFTAVNLASAYSLAGKRTVLVGFDLRRPNFPSSFGSDSKVGLSTYLIGKSRMEEIVYATDFQNLSVLPAGPIPPNPGELSTSDKIVEMFDTLRRGFDFIIVDSAPLGAVADGYSVAAVADANIVIVRHGRTIKRFLGATLSDAQAHGIRGLSVLVNDFRSKRSSYRYNYNYKYDSKHIRSET